MSEHGELTVERALAGEPAEDRLRGRNPRVSSGPGAPPPDLRNRYAGLITRFGGFLVDVVAIVTSFAIGSAMVEYTVRVLGAEDFRLSDKPVIGTIAMAVWVFFYSAYSVAAAGHTLGMAIAGVRVVRRDGSPIDGWHAVWRVLFFPFSFVLFGLGFALILLRRDRRALHDLLAGTAVVYDWQAYARKPRFLTRRDPES